MAEFDARDGKSQDGGYNEDKDVKIKIGKEQFEKIARTVEEFDTYMRETMKTTYETKLAKEGIRAKGWNPAKESKASAKKSKKKERDISEESTSEEEKRGKARGTNAKTTYDDSDAGNSDDTDSETD